MKAFRDQILAQAVRLRSESVDTPAWLASAKEAFAEFASGPAEKERAMAFARRLGEIQGWPESPEALRGELDARARPIEELLSKAFCSIEQDAQGRDMAKLWGGEGALIIDNGSVATQANGLDAAGLLGSRAAGALFNSSDWETANRSSSSLFMGPPGRGKTAALAATGHRLADDLRLFVVDGAARGRPAGPAPAGETEEIRRMSPRIKEDFEEPAADFSEVVGSALFGMDSSKSAKHWSVASFLINEERSARVLAETAEKFGKALSESPGKGFTDFLVLHEALHARMGASPEFREIREEQRRPLSFQGPREKETGSEGGVSGEERASPFDEKATLGVERANELSQALREAGPRALGRARADAGERLVALLEEKAPLSRAAEQVASAIWGLPLSLKASDSASAWAPVAARLLKEDPRRGALALAMAPALGLAPSADLLSQVKGELKSMGWSDGLWKSVGALTQEAFDSALSEFRQDDEPIEALRKQADPRFLNLTGGSVALPRDPFASAERHSRSAEAMKSTAAEIAIANQAARIAGVSFSDALSFCSSSGALSSKAWRPVEPRKPTQGLTNFILMDDLPDAAAFLGYGGGRAGRDFAAFYAGELTRALPSGAAEEMMRVEREALAAKAPRVLALAMKEARERPSKIKDVLSELEDLTDWFKRSEQGLWQQLPEKMSWASLRRREQAWHMELKASADAEFKKPWEALLKEPIQAEGRVARELASGAELFEEGQAMRHCVSTYAEDCRSGACRIYSITDEQGNRLATLEAKFVETEGGELQAIAAQLRGACNQRIEDEATIKASSEVVRALNESLTAQLKAAREGSPKPEAGGEAPSVLPALAWRREARRQEQFPRIPQALRQIGLPGGHG